jgi:acetylglutamate kinase
VLRTLLDDGLVPVVASIAADAGGQRFNVNADVIAAELAVGVGARKLVYVNDVPGVIGAGGDLLSELGVRDALALLAADDVVDGGMIPKLASSIRAIEGGVDRVHLIDGRVEHALVLELFTPEGIGTMLVRERPVDTEEPA